MSTAFARGRFKAVPQANVCMTGAGGACAPRHLPAPEHLAGASRRVRFAPLPFPHRSCLPLSRPFGSGTPPRPARCSVTALQGV